MHAGMDSTTGHRGTVNKGADGADGKAQCHPEQGKGQADLPPEVKGQVGIIPDLLMEGQIDQTAADQLHGGDGGGAQGGAQEDGPMAQAVVDMVDGAEADTAADRHTPMREAAE